MNTKSIIAAIVTLFLIVGVASGQKIKNKSTFTNNGIMSVGTFQNYNGAAGTLDNNNGATLTVSALLDNKYNAATVNNLGTITMTGASTFDNSLSGGIVSNTSNGLINMSGATSVYDNTAGTTTNSTTAAGKGFRFVNAAGGALVPGSGFTTSSGRVEYAGTGGTVYSGVATGTYGKLEINTSGTRTMDNSISVGDVTLTAGTFDVGSGYKLTVTGVGGVAGAGALTANGSTTTEVDYAGPDGQPIKSTTYAKLTLSGAGTRQKTISGDVTVANALKIDAGNELLIPETPSLYTLTLNSSSVLDNSGWVRIYGDISFGSSMTLTAIGSFEYGRVAAGQVVKPFSYANLTLSAGAKTMGVAPADAISVSGTYNAGATADYRSNTTSFTYAGGGAQDVRAGNYYTLAMTTGGAKSIGAGVAVEAKTVTVATGALTIDGTGSLQVGYTGQNGSMSISSNFTNNGDLTLGHNNASPTFYASLTFSGATLTNNLNIRVFGSDALGTYFLQNDATTELVNSATGVIALKAADFVNNASFSNAGSITVE
ncbi:MAG: hypothetical protein V1799_13685 [bacterium]